MTLDIRYYLSICWRRLPIFLPIAAIAAAASFFYAISLPAKYQSSAVLLVESAQISEGLAQSTIEVSPNEQLQIIQQRLMTRQNLLDLARKFAIYDDINELSADEIERKMRSDSQLAIIGGRGQASQMRLSFEATRPMVAASVLNEYISEMLSESSEFRRQRAEGTLEFFEQEVARLSSKLDQQSARIMSFQTENSDALPSTLNYRLDRYGQLQENLTLNERERISLEDQKRRTLQIFEMTGRNSETSLPEDQRVIDLEDLRNQLRQALLVYSEENPRVKLLRSRVESLEADLAGDQDGEGEAVDPQAAILDLQIQELDQRIAALVELNKTYSGQIEELQDTIDRTPSNQITLDALGREYDILEAQYNTAVSRMNTAAEGERIEVLSKGERITILEQPSIPTDPTSPNRPLIAVAGSALGMGAAVALIVLLELLNNSIRRPVELTNRFGITPIGVVPVIRTPGDRFSKGLVLLCAITIVAVGIPAALFAVHSYVMPLDLLAVKALSKLGV